ncbi:MAG TPA: FHIPEP family type III secretion protein [Streptosporangiaceae bacterium]|nr:FHIPEP family type III secretion protein [Streptosporangiaceae bacterium]
MDAEGRPVLSISVLVGRELSAIATPEAMALAGEETGREISGLMAALGVPGDLSVTVAPLPAAGDERDDGSSLRFTIGDKACVYPADLARDVWAWLSGQLPPPDRVPDNLDAGAAAKLIALTCREAVKLQPAVLLDLPQASFYCREAGLDAGDVPAGRVHRVLQGVVGLGHSIADQDTVRRVLAGDQNPGIGAREALVAELGGATFALRVAPAYLRQLTIDYADAANLIAELRAWLLTEYGVIPPGLQLIACESLPPGTFSIKVNELETLPVTGLAAGKLLVNGSVELLREHDIPADPSSYANGAIISQDSRLAAEAAGLTAWDQLNYIVLSIMKVANERIYQLVDKIQVEKLLNLTWQSRGWLVEAARKVISADQLTAVLRELLACSISVSDLPPVLDALIEAELTGDPDFAGRVEAVRAALSDKIMVKALQGQQMLPAVLLDPALEEALVTQADGQGDSWLPPGADGSLVRRLTGRLRAELAKIQANAAAPVLLTGSEARPEVQSALRPGFPDLFVISYDELSFPPGVQVFGGIEAGAVTAA